MKLLAALFVCILCGCATPPGKMKDSDFVLRSVQTDLSVQEVFSNLQKGLRYCGSHSGGTVLATFHGNPQCSIMGFNELVICDLYGDGAFGGRSDYVFGRIDIKKQAKGTLVELRALNVLPYQEKVFKSWEMFIVGKENEVCPEGK